MWECGSREFLNNGATGNTEDHREILRVTLCPSDFVVQKTMYINSG